MGLKSGHEDALRALLTPMLKTRFHDMSTGQPSRHRPPSANSNSRHQGGIRNTPPPTTLTPENPERAFEPCAATGSFLLYAQRNVILCLHHDTLAIEKRIVLHRGDVRWICLDNASERGAGRLAVSYDTANMAIVWDIFTGVEVSRFTPMEEIKVAAWMRNGNIAFGTFARS